MDTASSGQVAARVKQLQVDGWSILAIHETNNGTRQIFAECRR